MNNTIRRALFIIMCLFMCYPVRPQNYPQIHANRPRILADSTRIDWLKTNITIPGSCQSTYNSFVYAYNNYWINDPQLYLTGNDSTIWTWTWSSQWAGSEAIYTILLYKLNNDALSLKRCRFLARQVINRIDTANFNTMEWYAKENLLRQMSDAGSILLDWTYDVLPDTLRNQLARSQFRMCREFMNTFILSSAGNSYVSSHNAWNTIYCNQNTLALYNADGLSTSQKDTVNQWYQAVYNKWVNGFLPCYGHYRDDDGGWNWGAAYSMWSLVDNFQLFENMRIGTNKNFYTDLPWVQNSINQYWYFNQPDGKSIHLGDGQSRRTGDRVDYLHARWFNDPRSLWTAQYWSDPSRTPNTWDKFNKLLYKDFSAIPVLHPNPPLNWWSDKTGLSVSRSSWNSDATMVTFFCSPSKRAAHEHRDNNSFTVFKNSPLLIDAGYYDTYGGSHYRNYYQRTIAHNSIVVYDSSENYSCFGQPASNDGGQIESAALQNYNDIFLPQNQRGKWIKFASGNNYSYNVADAQLSYDTSKLDYFRRRLLFLKPGKIIVVDNIHLKNRSTAQRDVKWIAHTVRQPEINGSILHTAVPGHIYTCSGNEYKARNKNSSVAVKTILPVNSTTTLIGGNAYQYWVDGLNYPPLSAPDTNFYAPGNWRIEVKPSIPADSVIFLHTISVSDTLNMAIPGGIAMNSQYSAGVDWNDTLYFFSARGDTNIRRHVFYSVPGSRTAGLFASDLRPGAYWVKVDNIPITFIATDTNGILQTSLLLTPGNHTVEIADDNFGGISGYITYQNPSASPLAGVSVHLKDSTQAVIATCMTSATGFYSFDSVAPGLYTLTALANLAAGGYNTTDALLVSKHFVNQVPLSGLYLNAASVRMPGVVNALDALYVQRRFMQIITGFPAGDWVFEKKQIVVVHHQSHTLNLKGLCYGDVNGSYLPAAQ